MSILSDICRPSHRAMLNSRPAGRPALFGAAAMMLITVACAGTAHATVFGGTATFIDTTTGAALNLSATPNPNTFTTTNLTATPGRNTDAMIGFMTVTATAAASQNLSCYFFSCGGVAPTDPIALQFVWTQPSTAPETDFGGDIGTTTFQTAALSNGQSRGTIGGRPTKSGNYAQQTVTFDDGAVADIDLFYTLVAGPGGSQSIRFDVSIMDVQDPTAVPEPMSLALLGMGMTGLCVVRRRTAVPVPARV